MRRTAVQTGLQWSGHHAIQAQNPPSAEDSDLRSSIAKPSLESSQPALTMEGHQCSVNKVRDCSSKRAMDHHATSKISRA